MSRRNIGTIVASAGGQPPLVAAQLPNRLTQVFQGMKDTCPQFIKAYAVCVMETEKSDSNSTQHKACDKEFAMVKDCFQQVRQTTKR
jgi:hypothetical protein